MGSCRPWPERTDKAPGKLARRPELDKALMVAGHRGDQHARVSDKITFTGPGTGTQSLEFTRWIEV